MTNTKPLTLIFSKAASITSYLAESVARTISNTEHASNDGIESGWSPERRAVASCCNVHIE